VTGEMMEHKKDQSAGSGSKGRCTITNQEARMDYNNGLVGCQCGFDNDLNMFLELHFRFFNKLKFNRCVRVRL
jgi:hypothetical protein